MDTSWIQLLTGAGYEIRYTSIDDEGFYSKPQVQAEAWLNGKLAATSKLSMQKEKSVNSLTDLYRDLAIQLGLRSETPIPPIDMVITEEPDNGGGTRTTYTHPSFGSISLHRLSGGGGNCFMAPTDTFEVMELVIGGAQLSHTSLGTDHIFTAGKDNLIRVRMTNVQFAEMLTSQGSGSPCTITTFDNKQIEPVRVPPYLDRLTEQLTKTLETAVSEIKKIRRSLDPEMSGPGGLTAARKRAIWDMLDRRLRDIETTPSWLLRCWKEGANDILKHVKSEFSSWARAKIAHHNHPALSVPDAPVLERRNDDLGE